jgi:hypothetical protein
MERFIAQERNGSWIVYDTDRFQTYTCSEVTWTQADAQRQADTMNDQDATDQAARAARTRRYEETMRRY